MDYPDLFRKGCLIFPVALRYPQLSHSVEQTPVFLVPYFFRRAAVTCAWMLYLPLINCSAISLT